MKMLRIDDVRQELAFVEAAAKAFKADKKATSYSEGLLQEGSLLALRWGFGNDCVLVFRLTEEPRNYQNCVGKETM